MYIKRTTIEIDEPDELFIRSKGWTYRSAFKVGINALREQDANRAVIEEMKLKIQKLSSRLSQYMLDEARK